MEFRLPDIGEGTAEGEVVRWLVKPGDAVTEDQPLVEVMTDKATVTIPCPVSATIETLLAKEGQVVAVGSPIVVFKNVTQGTVANHGHARPGASQGAAAASGADGRGAQPPAGTATLEAEPGSDRVLATPATRRRARELGVDIRRVRPTGPGGRVTRDDVERVAQAAPTATTATPRTPPRATPKPEQAKAPVRAPERAAPPPAPRRAAPLPPSPVGQTEERVPLRGIRRKIAEHLVKSKFTAPHFTYVEDVDVTDLVELREKAKPIAEQRGVKLTYLPFIMKSVVAALRDHPALNASLDDAASEIVYKRYYNLGIAVETDAGLVVPVIKAADQRSILDLAREIERLSQAARTGTLELEDLQGGTFTISSVGSLGGLMATPILNHPEVAIMGVHKIAKRPVVRGDRIEIGHVMYLSLSLDHRVVDGAQAARFMSTVVQYIQDPKLLLLEGL
jgi:pyruvate dehydrogenase E2 component (dihydrolipoamide acetyltransferase)